MKEKILSFSLLSLGILSGGILLFVAVKFLLPVTAPFLIAWVMALATRTPARKLSERIRVPERVLRLMMSLFLTLFVFSAIAVVVWQGTAALWSFLSDVGEGNALYDILNLLSGPGLPFLGDVIPPELLARISDAVGSVLTSMLSRLGAWVTSLVGAVPGVLLFILVTVIALIYFAFDLERINGFVKAILPPRGRELLTRLRRGLFDVGRRYIRSYFLITLITYSIVLVGFFILGVKKPLLTAIFVSLLDILPVIGVGTVLIPWGVIQIALGNHFLGIGLLVLFVVNATVRQLAEPKIVGKSLNMHPILTLLLIYVGYGLFGIMGLFALPVIAVILAAILKKDHPPEVA